MDLPARTLRFPAESVGTLIEHRPGGRLTTPAAGVIEVGADIPVELRMERRWPEVLQQLGERDLQSLWLSYNKVKPADVVAVSRLIGLRELGLTGKGTYNDDTCRAIAPLTELRRLCLNNANNRFTDEGLTALTGLTELRSLQFCHALVTDDGLAALRSFEKLEHLTLTGCRRLRGPGLAHIGVLALLESLWLNGVLVGDDDLAPLRGLTALKVVCFGGDVTVEGLRHLPKNEGLTIAGFGRRPSPEQLRTIPERFPHIVLGARDRSPRPAPAGLRDRLRDAGRPIAGASTAPDAPLLVMFTGDSCIPCVRLEPELEKVAQRLHDEVATVQVNVSDKPELAAELSILSVPTLALLPNRTHVRYLSARTADALLDELQPMLG